MKTPTVILEYEKVCEDVCREFLAKYFPGEQYDREWWVGREPGGVYMVSDYYFNLERMVEALRYRASSKKLFDYYDLELNRPMEGKDVGINLYHYLKKEP